MFSKLLITLMLAALTSLALGYLDNQSLSVPASLQDWGRFLILFGGMLTAVLLTSTTSAPADDEDEDEETAEYDSDDFEEGTVKWFNTKKGYGFITRDQAHANDVAYVPNQRRRFSINHHRSLCLQWLHRIQRGLVHRSVMLQHGNHPFDLDLGFTHWLDGVGPDESSAKQHCQR